MAWASVCTSWRSVSSSVLRTWNPGVDENIIELEVDERYSCSNRAAQHWQVFACIGSQTDCRHSTAILCFKLELRLMQNTLMIACIFSDFQSTRWSEGIKFCAHRFFIVDTYFLYLILVDTTWHSVSQSTRRHTQLSLQHTCNTQNMHAIHTSTKVYISWSSSESSSILMKSLRCWAWLYNCTYNIWVLSPPPPLRADESKWFCTY